MKYKCLVCGKIFEPSKFVENKLKGLSIEYLNTLELKTYDHPVPLCCSSCRIKYQHLKIGSPFGRKEVREKSRKTLIDRYGVDNAMKIKSVQEKIKKTNLERYGAENSWCKNSSVRHKCGETFRKRYNCQSNLARKEVIEKARETVKQNKKDNPNWINNVIEKYHKTMLERYGVSNSLFLNPAKTISETNKLFDEKLQNLGFTTILEKYINNYYYDIFIEDLNILIEINPWYTHNSTYGTHWNDVPIDCNYHYNKTKSAVSRGYRVINIWDWDNIDKILDYLNSLKNTKIIYARNCKIKQISNKESRIFCDNYHFQNSTRSSKYAYGLFYNNDLVQIMTFGKPRYNKTYEYELLRLCTKYNYKVIGGANKLLKHFEENIKPESLVSYCDLSKFSGEVYEKLGMKYLRTSICKHWFNINTSSHIIDNLLKQLGFDKLHGTKFGKGTSNEALMIEHDYVEIYDCGQNTYIKEYK